MKPFIHKRLLLSILLIVLAALWLVPAVFAGPLGDAGVPTFTPTPTFTLPPPTALPPATFTPTTAPYPAPTQPVVAAPSDTPVAVTPGGSNAPEQTGSATAAGSSVLGFLLCVGVLIVAGLAALNIWSRRRP